MPHTVTLNDVLENAEKLIVEEQESLMNLLHRRLIERRRDLLLRDVRSARQEHQKGKTIVVTVDELMKEIRS